MAVRIEVAHGLPWYTNSDVVRGRIALDLRQSSAISSVSIALIGMSRTALTRVEDKGQKFTDEEQEVVTVLMLEHQLFPPRDYHDQYTLRPGSHSWPFEFRVPDESTTDITQYAAAYGLASGQGAGAGSKAALPPSLSDMDADTCAIRYYLRALVERRSPLGLGLGLGASQLSAHAPVIVLPSDPPLDHLPTFGAIHTSTGRVVSSAKSMSGLFNRLVSTLAHDRAPVCVSTVFFEQRSELLLTPGLKFSWLLEVSVLKPGETAHIHSVQIELVARTHVRAKNLVKVVEKTTNLFSRSGMDLVVAGHGDVTALLDNPVLRLPESVPPCFAFANVMREYRLDTKVKYGHRPSSALVHKAVLSRKVWVRAGMHALPSYETGEIMRADRGFPQSASYFKKL